MALTLLEHSDAVGRIVARTDDGLVQCTLVHCNSCTPEKLVTVEEIQLLLRVYV